MVLNGQPSLALEPQQVRSQAIDGILPTITRLRYLRVEFDLPLQPWEIPAFRGAMIDKMGRDNDLFHNHLDGENKFAYRYATVQYKSIDGRAAIVGLNAGADALQSYFAMPHRNIEMGGMQREMVIDDLRMQQVVMRTWNQQFHYRIQNWIALQDEAYPEYNATIGLAKKAVLLERRLTNTMVTMAKGLDWWVDEPIQICVTQFWEPHLVRLKGVRFSAFNVEFTSNVFLPDYIGLGKATALGFGVVKSIQPRSHGK
jgi:hypothetical protein